MSGWTCPNEHFEELSLSVLCTLEPVGKCRDKIDDGSCPHAPALRAVVDDPEMVLIAEHKDCTNCGHYDRGYKGPCRVKASPNHSTDRSDYCDQWTPTHDQKEA